MATFVMLVNWTEQGIRNYRDTSKRADAFTQSLKKYGASLKDIYWTLGAYDIVAVVDAPDDESMTAAALDVGSLGNIRTTTLRGFSRAELGGIIKKIG